MAKPLVDNVEELFDCIGGGCGSPLDVICRECVDADRLGLLYDSLLAAVVLSAAQLRPQQRRKPGLSD
ncbi:hypothetical protein [Mycobacterium sp. 141]|uniref:hypothetical protein n=1 Tax=Mycobacterium sp. 141 TaxID=1120797 RepID=UPI00037A95B1|nr:hypothetical protein [Mycobacterium sp. 141]